MSVVGQSDMREKSRNQIWREREREKEKERRERGDEDGENERKKKKKKIDREWNLGANKTAINK